MVGNWLKRTAHWTEDNTAYVSVPFTWGLPKAFSTCVWYQSQGYRVKAGGPAVSLMPDVLKGVAETGDTINALPHHNPNASFTSRGCPNKCPFCAVPRIEGDLVELDYWEPKPIICDNNLLACSQSHLDRVFDSLRGIPDVDFNQGLDARLLTTWHLDRMRSLDIKALRFAWDNTKSEPCVLGAIEQALKAGFPKCKIHVYVLIGYDDTPEDALYRLQTLKDLGIWPNPQRYQPLNAMIKNQYVNPNWTDAELRRFHRYWSRLRWFEHIPFEEYKG